MNIRATLRILGHILLIEAALMVLSVAVALIYGEPVWYFLAAMGIMLAVGGLCQLPKKTDRPIYAREGFVIVALSWIFLSVAGCLPFVFSGYIPSFIDALFETVSGFTTTGSSILPDVEALPNALLFWRSFTHWVGGMGVLVFVMAVLPMSKVRSVHLMRAEVPGPTKGKLVPKMRSTAQILYGIYVIMTMVEVILLVAGGMPLLDAFIHAFGSAGTGGFSNKALSVGAYGSVYFEVVISVFMILFGVNFNLYYLLLLKNFRAVYKNEELRCYLGVIAAATVLIAVNILSTVNNIGQALAHSFFQVSSIITTTGFSSVDFQLWPSFSRYILVFLMLIGACAGSTGGGIKVSRIVIAAKSVRREMHRLLRPREVEVLQLNGETMEEDTVKASNIFIVAYFGVMVISSMAVSLSGYDLETSVTAVIACLSNIGPGLSLVGPMGNFSIFSAPIKLLLTFNMLLGRLELYPMLMLLAPSTWRRR
ncbi:MAG: TrkH family potassium uptake protein [Christensenellaceae bacterium]|nr:TrkH family potassium uptake protein [Christensenellaceae bacterium]